MTDMRRTTTAALGLLFLACIIGANYATEHHGMVPVGLGFEATAGTYAAGLTFLLRDAIQELGGRRVTLALIVLGAALSAVVAPALALASGVAFLLAELTDWAAYQPLRRRGFIRAAIVSNVVGAVVDTYVFLELAGFPVTTDAVAGQLLGKLGATTAALIVFGGIRALLRQRVNRRRA